MDTICCSLACMCLDSDTMGRATYGLLGAAVVRVDSLEKLVAPDLDLSGCRNELIDAVHGHRTPLGDTQQRRHSTAVLNPHFNHLHEIPAKKTC